jgi:DNA-directed RNA polymerase subunit M/transcription elongation factor TFIIS
MIKPTNARSEVQTIDNLFCEQCGSLFEAGTHLCNNCSPNSNNKNKRMRKMTIGLKVEENPKTPPKKVERPYYVPVYDGYLVENRKSNTLAQSYNPLTCKRGFTLYAENFNVLAIGRTYVKCTNMCGAKTCTFYRGQAR